MKTPLRGARIVAPGLPPMWGEVILCDPCMKDAVSQAIESVGGLIIPDSMEGPKPPADAGVVFWMPDLFEGRLEGRLMAPKRAWLGRAVAAIQRVASCDGSHAH